MSGGDEDGTRTTDSSCAEAISFPVSLKPDCPDHVKQVDGSTSSTRSANAVNNDVNKAKSCKGCLYYSSRLKADSRNPVCVGLTRSLPQVPQYIIGQSEMEASKEGRSLTDFRYACVGYSLFVDRKKEGASGQEAETDLPVCVGLEMLVDRRVVTADSAKAPTTTLYDRENSQDGRGSPQHRSPKSPNSAAEDYFVRFTRNANLVANAVAKNICKVGNQIKHSLDEILDRRPK